MKLIYFLKEKKHIKNEEPKQNIALSHIDLKISKLVNTGFRV